MSNDNSGCGCGAIIEFIGLVWAVIVSWEANHSFVWAFIHGLFGWFYLLYYWIFK